MQVQYYARAIDSFSVDEYSFDSDSYSDEKKILKISQYLKQNVKKGKANEMGKKRFSYFLPSFE